MDVAANFQKLIGRMADEKPQMLSFLRDISREASEELSKSGSLLAINGETVARRSAGKSIAERLQLSGEVGRYLVEFSPSEGLNCYTLGAKGADSFPSCIAMAAAAILENFNGRLRGKMKINIVYATERGRGDPLGSLLPLIGSCYPFAELSYEPTLYGREPEPGKHRRRKFGL